MKNYEILPERNYLRQAPEIVNGRWSLTKQESNILLLVLGAIQKEDEEFKDYIFEKSDLERRMGVAINSRELKTTVKQLMSRVLEVPTEKGYKLFNWFSYFEYADGVCTCSFDERLKPYLLELKQFVLADSRHLLDMKSEYSRRIYMLLKEYAKFGTRTFNVEELQDILQVPKSMKRYDNFKRQILLRAEADINKFSDLEVKLSEKKLGRKVV
ncbi:MAG: replication initiation protein, partial [Sulfurimonas sp.]